MAAQRALRRFFHARLLAWRHFWSLRADWRIRLATICALVAVVIVVYLVIPTNVQIQVNQALATAIQAIVSLNRTILLAGVAGFLVLICVGLIYIRPYRRSRYLATTLSAIPPISVYLDAENQIPEPAIRQFTQFLMEFLNGRRADLLYFLDASVTATSNKYKTLYRFGFRPVDVPHDPTGTVAVKEAVDKELSMHAYERALLGPPNQEFIIVTGDQDFVALVYRLAALGHHVQVWASPIRAAYRELATYLDIELIDLTQVISDLASSSQQEAEGFNESTTGQKGAASVPSRGGKNIGAAAKSSAAAMPTILAESGEQQIYRAIVGTITARNTSAARFRTHVRPTDAFQALLGNEIGSRLAGIGYTASGRLEYWRLHLQTVGVLGNPQRGIPTVGDTPPEVGARALFAVVQLAAASALAVGNEHSDATLSMTDVANRLISQEVPESAEVKKLVELAARDNGRRATHVRYFVRSARALGLIEFDDVPNSTDLIRSPRLAEVPALVASDSAIAQAAAPSPAGEKTSDD